MGETRRAYRGAAWAAGRLAWLALIGACAGAAFAEPPPAVVNSESLVRSLQPAGPRTRALVVEQRPEGDGGRKVNLDIRFANDSDRLTPAAYAQLAELGAALSSPELARSRFLIAGHTSASGNAVHNQRLSEARAQAVRRYLLERHHIAPGRIEATGFGSSRPLPDVPRNAPSQRRVEISTLAPAS
jgi:outer membrane protein OmpA-like peptidoglycan-associated protein